MMGEPLTVIEGGMSYESGDRASALPGTKTWSAKVRKRAKELINELDTGYMELARILYQVYDAPVDGDPNRGSVLTSWGYGSFQEYAEMELGIHRKRAMRLRLIWYTLEFQLKDLDPGLRDRIAALGYSKVRELVRILTIRNAESWVSRAEHMTYRQLYQEVCDEKRRQGVEQAVLQGAKEDSDTPDGEDADLPSPTEPESIKQERFDLFPAQLENIQTALKAAGEISGSSKKGHLLDLICTDYLASNDLLGDSQDVKLRFVAKIERTLGLKFIVVDPETNDVVYGYEALKRLSEDS